LKQAFIQTDKEDLIQVYERAKGKVYNPEYEFIEN